MKLRLIIHGATGTRIFGDIILNWEELREGEEEGSLLVIIYVVFKYL